MQAKSTTDKVGLDISSLQTITDETLLFSKIDFLICRAYGSNHATGGDTQFTNYVNKAKAHGCPVGSYFFGTPFVDANVSTDAQITANAQAQAQDYINKLEGAFGTGNYGDLTPMLDVESYTDQTTQYGHTATNLAFYPQESGMTGDQFITWVKAFRDYFFSKTKRRCGFYSNRYFLTTTDLDANGKKQGMGLTTAQLTALNNMPLWLAEYDQYYGGSTGNVQPADLAGWTRYVAWQYSGTGVASDYGLSHPQNYVDLDRTPSLDWLLVPPPPTTLGASQTADNTITVTFTKPDIVDYLGADLYINGVWKKWITATTNAMETTTFDITAYTRNVDLAYQIQIEDTYSDIGYSPTQTLRILPTLTESQVISMPIVAMGTTIKKGTTAIAELTSIDGINVTSDTHETTTLDSIGGYRTFVAGLKDSGEVGIGGHFAYSSHNTLMADFESQAVNSYTIEFPDKGATGKGTQWTFSGIVTAFKTGVALEDLISFEATIKVSGKPTLVAPA